MMNQKHDRTVSFDTGAWLADRAVKIFFPPDWKLKIHTGTLLRKLSKTETHQKLENAIGVPGLTNLLKKGKKVVVIIDDLTRPTNVYAVLKHIILKAKEVGILEKNIAICIAYGTHILNNKSHMRQKLGDILDSEIEIVHHNCQNQNELRYVGQTRAGIPIWIHQTYAKADVRIAISGVCPHDDVGYSGGAKILLGVCGLTTISMLHNKFYRTDRGRSFDTPFRYELENMADVAGLDYSINLVTNHKRETVELFSGDFRKAFRLGAGFVQRHFGVAKPGRADIVIANSYPIDNSLSVFGKSFWPFNYCKRNAYKIIIASPSTQSDQRIPLITTRARRVQRKLRSICRLSQIRRNVNHVHDLMALKFKPGAKLNNRFFLYIPHVDGSVENAIESFEDKKVVYSWKDLIEDLSYRFSGKPHPTVCIYTHAPLQYPAFM